MGILNFFCSRQISSAQIAKERLRIIVATERSLRPYPPIHPALKKAFDSHNAKPCR